MSERVFKDTRLLEALEFIDDEYIASAARYKMKYEAQPAEPPKMTWRTPFKHWKQLVALAACILLLSVASPLVSYIAQVISNFNAGAGSGTTETESEIGTTIDAENSNDMLIDDNTATEMTDNKTIESTSEEANWLFELFGDSKISSFPSNMSEEVIYQEVLKGGWVVGCSRDNSGFVAGGDLWQNFCEKSSRLEPCSVLLAYYYKDAQFGEDHINLTEIKFDGELFYHAQLNSLTDTIEDCGTYKYLIKDFYEIYKGPVIDQGLVKAYFLSNDNTWTYREWSHIQLCSISHHPRNYYRDCVTITVQFVLYDDSVSVPTGEYPVYDPSAEYWHSDLFD